MLISIISSASWTLQMPLRLLKSVFIDLHLVTSRMGIGHMGTKPNITRPNWPMPYLDRLLNVLVADGPALNSCDVFGRAELLRHIAQVRHRLRLAGWGRTVSAHP